MGAMDGGSTRAWCDEIFCNCPFVPALLGRGRREGIGHGYGFFKFIGRTIHSSVNRRIYSAYVPRIQVHSSVAVPRKIF
jgi:hypothetical protein